ncbi:serine hydrolase domain-containing protein [Actinomadura sp. 6N118]|uniref:serine hydrolase domain-containing protein n=1 Tax=Actinomadura sp. 6N118 TaxID=3375151 RepID=UPI0037A31BD2
MKCVTTARAGLACMVTLSIAVPATAAASARTGFGPDRMGNVQQALNTLAGTTGVVGAIGQVYVDGRRVGQGSAGTRLLGGRGGSIPADSRYRIGSQTKGMTATVVLQLVKEGRLGLEDKLSDILPEVANHDLVERAGEITVRQLIRNTSGIPNWFTPGLVDIFDTTTYVRPIDLVRISRGQPRTGEPGEKFFYSNTNYTLLGMIIEKVTGTALAAEFARRLFVPLGMNRTYLPTRPPEGIKGPHGHGYHPDADGRPRDMHRFNASYGGAAGGVISTAHDITAFHRAFAQGELLPPSLQRVITDPPEGVPQPPAGGLCGGAPVLQGSAGGAPGFNAVTFTTADGRHQLAISTTVSLANAGTVSPAVNQAVKAVFCPEK